MLDIWMTEFSQSALFGGLHFVSESVVSGVPFPTVLVDRHRWVGNGTFDNIGPILASKLLQSIEFFLAHSSAPFFVPMTADVYLWVRNLPLLMDSVREHNYTGDTKFIWGNCLTFPKPFIQGAVYFMSRETARLLAPLGERWFRQLHTSMDVDFMGMLSWIGLGQDNFTSEHILAQYLPCEHTIPMETMNMSVFPDCPPVPARVSPVCAPFQVQFNKLVLLHRLTNCRFTGHQLPVYHYPSYLYWSMSYLTPSFCVKRPAVVV
jgi:hypothetical protein